jgi:hypothetical protein
LISRSSLSSPISFRRHDSINNRDINPGFLPNGTVLQDPADTSSTSRSRPDILLELASFINSLDGSTNAVLGVPDHLLEAGPHVSPF